MSGFTPVNQVRLTNVATVRLQKKGKRFEIACYRNKVLSWRNKLETDLKEVLQIGTVFTNVSKGMLASSKDLIDAFGTSDQKLVCQEILEKGEMQVSEQERVALHETVFRDIASIVAEKTVNPNNNLPYTITMIQNAMRQIQFSVNLSKSSKSQALDVIRKLKDIMPIARASMLIRIVYSSSDVSQLASEIDKIAGQIVQKSSSESDKGESYVDIKIDPEYYRRMEEFVKELGFGRVEVIQMRMAGAVAPGTVSASAVLGGASSSTGLPVESKEGDDVYPPDRAEAATGQGVDEPVPAPAASKSKSGKEKSVKGGRGKSGGLEGLLAEVGLKDLHDDSDAESFDEYEVVQSSKSKKKTKKAKQVVLTTNDDDSDEDGGNDDSEALATQSVSESVASTTVTASSSVPGPSAGPAGNSAKQKIGKKEKRAEKELQKEREEQAKLLQERILRQKKEQEQQQLQQQQQQASAAAAAASEATASNAEVNGAEASAPTTDTVPPTSTVTSVAPVALAASTTTAVDPGSSAAAPAGKAQSCNTCGGLFYDSKLYRDHFKSDWHRFNLKRKMKNLPLITSEEEFLNLPLSELQLA